MTQQQDSPRPVSRVRGILRWTLRVGLALAALLALAIAVGTAAAWTDMGTAPTGPRAERMQASPNWKDGIFRNAQPLWNDTWGSLVAMTEVSAIAVPSGSVPTRDDTAEVLASPPSGLRVTWLGHSTTLIEIAGKRVLTDPMFGPSPFPLQSLGPSRWYPPPVSLASLEGVDAVLISHDHYDHLDQPTIAAMKGWDTTFIAPLGVGAHLEYWGVDPSRIVELDWWEEHDLGGLTIAATPARHASGRHALDQGRTLWASYAVLGPDSRVFFGGDTGLFDDMATIGEKYGPFDLVMIEVGAYHRAWPDWHIGPEQAVIANGMLRGKLFMPIHWGLFSLAMHGWTEPIERVWVAANAAEVPFVTPMPGEVFEPATPPAPTRWWPEEPWQTAAEHPIISTRNGKPDERYEHK